jgi:signal transduction histidine kinase
MEMIGGRFEVESAPGKGTTVTAQIPFDKAARPGAGESRMKPAVTKLESS